MRDDLGKRVSKVASKDIVHGRPVVEKNLVGFAAKSDQIDRFVRPESDEATTIETGARYVLFVGGSHELHIGTGGAPSGTVEGDLLYIDPADNSVKKTAEDGDLPLGVVQSVDTSRDPDVVLVNTNNLAAFSPADVA